MLSVDADERDYDALVADGDIAVVEAPSVSEAGDALDADRVDCVVTEYDLLDGTGLDVLTGVREMTPDTPVVLFTDASPARIDPGGAAASSSTCRGTGPMRGIRTPVSSATSSASGRRSATRYRPRRTNAS
ncbi:hypothetical protein [Halosimplex amylolyticum]|uniref:hypothetical protein n=1 Tax=Halosimplex amylolyticum TaxID=3396616 RepID=UPI003F56CDDD